MVNDKTLGSRVFDIVIYTILAAVLIVTLYPVLNIISISLSSANAVDKNIVSFYPQEFTFKAYELIFQNNLLIVSFLNSIFYTLAGTAISLALTVLVAYPMSKSHLPFRRFYTLLLLVTLFFSGGLVPSFLNVVHLGMYDTALAMLIPGALSTYNIILMTTFFKNLPKELEDSAYLDGAGDMAVLLRIVLPTSTASLATIGLFYAVGKWNDWFSALIFLKSVDRFPLPLILRQLVIQNQLDTMMNIGGQAMLSSGGNSSRMLDDNNRRVTLDTLKYATLWVSMIPLLAAYPFVQKYFVKGVMLGSLKG